ncbi:MAG TPA: tRNA (cytidine(34)-2'-O)-methyltransferase [Burkholderiaceae bacterium]|nr:tRNA (cytidine(34)-2'-O)-methyltransferase [Burkholderiaceae bacterium]
MFNVVLVAPEIPPNTGNVIRLCANSGSRLHLVRPLGFDLTDKHLRRAGLDYHEYAEIRLHDDFDSLLFREQPPAARLFCCTTHGARSYADVAYAAGDWLVFGSESRGLDIALRDRFDAERSLRVPMRPDNRSLNLSNAVAVVIYEAWRQLRFAGGQ